MLSAAIVARWQCPEASSEALDLFDWAICTVLYWRTPVAIEMASKAGPFFAIVLFDVALAATWTIRSEYLPNGGVQWFPG